MRRLTQAVLLATFIPFCSAADLAYSTYLRDGFTPSAITSDAQGNLYVAGTSVIDPASGAVSAVVAKLDPSASHYRYLEFLDSAASDSISGIAVDSAGNLFLTGTTYNPNFPVTSGIPPNGLSDSRAYVTKLGPNGTLQFSVLIGGSATTSGLGIAVTSQGQILVSGISGPGFAATKGAYSVPDTTNKWFLVELDATASKVIFSASGIGGRYLALDAASNIFMAGSSTSTDYPTTPGAYQTTFVQGHFCYGFCRFGFPGELQHLTKVDPTGSKLIYSTGLNDPKGGAGSTVTTGLAVDAAGNAYLSGTLFEGQYPFTIPVPVDGPNGGFVTKVDPTGSSLLFSVPYGGNGIARDSAGAIYTAGNISTYEPVGFPGIQPPRVVRLLDALSWVPAPCVPNSLTATGAAFLLKLDPATGSVLDAQWIDGASPSATSVTFAGTKLWAVGTTVAPDVPITPGALSPASLPPGTTAGVFLSAADFSKPAATAAPVIACVLDAGNMTHAGPVAGYRILAIFGANLGPDNVTVAFDGTPVTPLYESSSQINVMVPMPPAPTGAGGYPKSTVMKISVAGNSVQRQFPLIIYNLNLFAQVGQVALGCNPSTGTTLGFQAIALNSDGSRNSCTNPAQFGATVSLFVHGVGGDQLGLPMPDTVDGIQAQFGACGANIEKVTRSGVIYQVDVRLPPSLLPCTQNYVNSAVTPLSLTLRYHGAPVGPLFISSNPVPAQSQAITVWAAQ